MLDEATTGLKAVDHVTQCSSLCASCSRLPRKYVQLEEVSGELLVALFANHMKGPVASIPRTLTVPSKPKSPKSSRPSRPSRQSHPSHPSHPKRAGSSHLSHPNALMRCERQCKGINLMPVPPMVSSMQGNASWSQREPTPVSVTH
jgi:hypothetical protein